MGFNYRWWFLDVAGCASRGVQPIDTLYADFRDEKGLYAASLRRGGRVHRAPRESIRAGTAINESYMPSAEEIAHAHRVVAAFESAPGSGAVGSTGNDRHPH